MVYKIYPISEEKWLQVWKKIKLICRQQNLHVLKIDLEDYRGGMIDAIGEQMNNRQTTIFHLAEQQSLFASDSNVVNFAKPNPTQPIPMRDAKGHFVKRR